ncbi:hypothetical protein [Streptomyces sp. MZ04]|uniref:hypothetical protein n=1 Tax=Streptomyces sp. MZ04 TaxID=2559236 RepID=UPI001AE0160A|nr:hypothetical protein [Streptomyces sp. MZ04]
MSDTQKNGQTTGQNTYDAVVIGVRRTVGNVADARALVISAAGMGATAAFALNHDLVDAEVERSVTELRAATSYRGGGPH